MTADLSSFRVLKPRCSWRLTGSLSPSSSSLFGPGISVTGKKFKGGLSGSLFIGLLDAFEARVNGGGLSPSGVVNSRSSFLNYLTRSLCSFFKVEWLP